MLIAIIRDIRLLAQAAVSGNEEALDMFVWKKGSIQQTVHETVDKWRWAGFFIATEDGK